MSLTKQTYVNKKKAQHIGLCTYTIAIFTWVLLVLEFGLNLCYSRARNLRRNIFWKPLKAWHLLARPMVSTHWLIFISYWGNISFENLPWLTRLSFTYFSICRSFLTFFRTACHISLAQYSNNYFANLFHIIWITP